jgi:hypothetical protein
MVTSTSRIVMPVALTSVGKIGLHVPEKLEPPGRCLGLYICEEVLRSNVVGRRKRTSWHMADATLEFPVPMRIFAASVRERTNRPHLLARARGGYLLQDVHRLP